MRLKSWDNPLVMQVIAYEIDLSLTQKTRRDYGLFNFFSDIVIRGTRSHPRGRFQVVEDL